MSEIKVRPLPQYFVQQTKAGYAVSSVEGHIAYTTTPAVRAGRMDGKAMAQRICDCLNGCKGINPSAVPELLKAVEAAADYLGPADHGEEMVRLLRTALAMCKEG